MIVRDIELNVNIIGDGFSLIWGHGLTSSMETEDETDMFHWERMGEVLKLVRYDARGHGGSEASYNPEDYQWKNLAQDMLALADETGSERFIAGGQSMGCATSIYAALYAPQRVKALLLVNPPTAWETRAEQVSMYGKIAWIARILGGGTLARLMDRNPERLLPPWLVQSLGEQVGSIGEVISSMNGKTLSTIFRGAGLCDLPQPDELKSLDIPALILAWEGDKSHPVETAESLDQIMPQSMLHVAKDIYDFKTWPRLMREFVVNVMD